MTRHTVRTISVVFCLVMTGLLTGCGGLQEMWEGPAAPRHILRLCHCKPAAMLNDAVERITRWRSEL